MTRTLHAIAIRRFDVAAERVFDACLDPVWVGRWMFGPNVREERVVRLALEARVGGRFSFVVEREGVEIDHVGEYLAVDRPGLLVFTWATRDHVSEASRIVIEITPCAEGCEVKLTHVLGAGWSADLDRTASTWSRMLAALERAMAEETAAQPA